MCKFSLLAALLLASAPACMPKVYKPDFYSNVQVKADATVSVFATSQSTGWTGSGWYISSLGNTSVLATAGHVCNQPGFQLSGTMLPVTVESVHYTAGELDAYPVYDQDTDPDDVCLLFVNHAAPGVIRVADSVETGQSVHYVGYPDGVLGAYQGWVAGFDDGFTVISAPGYFGASGSAVVNDDNQAVGMLVKGDMNFTGHDWLVPIDMLKKAEAYADALLQRMASNPFDTSRAIADGTAIYRDAP
jgi:hypothetical protein